MEVLLVVMVVLEVMILMGAVVVKAALKET